MSRQLRLELQHPTSHRREDFVVSDANAEAVRVLDAWPDWPGGALVLHGPEGSGKTHLARSWAEHAGAELPSAQQLDLASLRGRPVLIENAETWRDGEALFHLINMAATSGGLLMTSRALPSAWPCEVPDLRSRLNALSVAELAEPDDALLEAVLLKLFRERLIRPAEDVLPYLLKRMERSVPYARDLVARIDEASGAEHRPVTRVLVRQILEIEPETPDLFE